MIFLPMRRLAWLFALLVLALLPTLFLWKQTLAGRILVGLDPFNFFYPYHDALSAAFRAGRLPEWNPWLFGGVPFLADSQAQVFYPLGWPFLWLNAPSALTWGVALHGALAALGCYGWARRGLGLGRAGAWAAGVLFALGGYLGAQVEHLNQVQAAAWLPWLLLGYEWGRALKPDATGTAITVPRRRAWGVALGAVALAMSLLAGHAQTTFISLVMLALWALRSAVRDDERTRAAILTVQRSGPTPLAVGAAWQNFLSVNALPLVAIVGIGALLAAVQLVPTQALSALSPRAGGLSLQEAAAFSLDPRLTPRAFLPTFGRDDALGSEFVAWIGFSGLALAAWAIFRSPNRAARDFGLLACGTGLFLALGGFNPVFWLLWRVVPGFDLFRAPARWLLLWALGAAVLAGAGVERKEGERERGEEGEQKSGAAEGEGQFAIVNRPKAADVVLAVKSNLETRNSKIIGVVGFFLAGAALLLLSDWPNREVWPWWGGAAGLAVVVLAVRRRWPALAVGLLVVELGLGWTGLDSARATAPEAYGGLRPAAAHLLAQPRPPGAGRLLAASDLTWDPGDLAALEARHAGRLGEGAIYDLVVVTKLKEVMAPNQPMRWALPTADGYGGGLLPSARWGLFQAVLPLAKVVPDGRLREQLTALPGPALLDVMGVEWLVADKVNDWWSEGIYHDLGAPLPLAAGASVERVGPGWEVDALSLVVRGDWPADPGTLTVGGRTLPLAAAEERATRETTWGTERHLLLRVEPPVPVTSLRVESMNPWILAGLTLVDTRLPAFEPLPADPRMQTTFSGDVKVYRRGETLGRAWVVPRAVGVVSAEAAARAIVEPGWDARGSVQVETAEATLPEGANGTVEWLVDEPEHLALQVAVPGGGWLVLADAPFPGWGATVDGQPTAWLPANVIGRALWLPPGSHEVRWQYNTPGLRAGALGSVLGLVVLLGWLGWYGRRSA